MPMDRSLYPDNWDEIATSIKNEVHWVCEECGRPCRKPGESIVEHHSRLKAAGNLEWLRDYWSRWIDNGKPDKPGRFMLTVAHLDHRPENCDRTNLKVLCAPCHCRYDLQPSSMFVKRQLKLERKGQLTLL